MRLLYVEDDLRDADITVRMLRRAGRSFEVEVVPTIEAALARLSQLELAPLDLVLTDMHLSDGDGISLLNHIRSSAIPVAVVVITGLGDEDTAVAALKARADDYVAKRKDYLERLPAILESALNHYRVDSARRARPLNVLYAEHQQSVVDETRRHLALNADHIQLNAVSFASAAFYLLENAKSTHYDVLLLDIDLPELNTLEAMRELREGLRLDAPVILLCSESDEEVAAQCLNRGATSYLVKRPGYLYQLPWELEDAHSRAELIRREIALQESEERFRAMADHAPVFVWVSDVDLLCTYVNKRWLEFTGRTLEQEIGNGWTEGIHPDDHDKCWDIYSTAFATRQGFQMEYRLRRNDGKYCWVLDTGVPRFTPDGMFIGYIGSAVDISERKATEEALRESESRLLLAQESAQVGTWEWHVPTGAAVWSEMLWHLLGLEPGACASRLETFVEFIHPDDRERVMQKVNEVFENGEQYQDEFRIVRRNGEVGWLSSKGRLIRSADGKPERMIGANIDITERKLGEESLKQAHNELQQLKDRLHDENIYLKEEIRVATNFGEMIGESEALTRVLHQAEQVAPLDTTVLILGETGTGKELLAHAIHNRSPRAKRSLVKVNCAALPADLIESELFGHEKGAFTGATSKRTGRFEIANSGTIFLDEVGELPLDLQTKLLRVLQEGEFEPVGSNRTVHVSVRVIAATNRNLEEAVRQGEFRSDLYYRLSIFPITLPPLRERRKDVPILVKHFVNEINRKFSKQIDTVPKEAMTALQNYPWPGNIRELRNVIERAMIISEGPELRLVDSLESLPSGAGDSQSFAFELASIELKGSRGETLEENQYNLILNTLKKSYWRVEGPYGAAAVLNIHPSKLRSLMKKLGIERPKIKTQSGGQKLL
ncbi:MAG TPA: sigma 54-interacting transcriptional regulator [Pyrinomonadaceae bacterium]|nr:sigma 54-interacting transcriptional regulator [Pyrinomonadaceae bacterium]